MLQENHLFHRVIFLLLLASGFFLSSTRFIDANLFLRYSVVFGLLMSYMLLSPSFSWSKPANWLVLAYIFSMLSSFWSISAGEAFFDAQRILLMLTCLLFFSTLLRGKDLALMSKALLVVSLVLMLVNAVWLVLSCASSVTFQGTSAHPNLLASTLFLFVPIILYTRQFLPKAWHVWSRASLVALVVLILAIGARSAIIALLCFGLLTLKLGWLKSLSRSLKVLVVLGAVSLLVVAWLLFAEGILDMTSLQERLFIWSKTIALVMENPITGVGAGNWALNFMKNGIGGFETFEIYGLRMQRPHNDFLWTLSELGIIGFILIAGFFMHIVWRWYQSENRRQTVVLMKGLLAFGVIAFFSFPKERIEHTMLLMLIMSFVYHQTDQTIVGFKGVKWTFLPFLLFALSVGALRLKGEYFGSMMLQAAQANQHAKVIEYGLKADGWAYHHISGDSPIAAHLANAYLRQNDQEKFHYWSEVAWHQAPNNYEVISNYGMALNSQKRYEESLTLLLKAHAMNPRYDAAILNLAIVNYNLQRYQKAKDWLDKVHFKSEITNYYGLKIEEKKHLIKERGQ